MSVLIIGGYGVVGAQIARILRKRNPDLALLIGGRSREKAEGLAQELGKATGVAFDVDDPAALGRLSAKPRLVVLAVNDMQDITLKVALAAGVALVDITRWTARVRDLEAVVRASQPTAPVVQGSSWMASIPGALACAATADMQCVDSINLSILYSVRDKSGDNSVEYMDRLSLPFPVVRDGKLAVAIPYAENRKTEFANGYKATAYRFDTPDQHVLPKLTGARAAAAFIAFDDKIANGLMWFIIRSGIWALLSSARFTSLRRGLLHNPGPGAAHHMRLDIQGVAGGQRVTRTIQITDPESQTHITAVGAVLQAEWALGLNGFVAPGAGLQYGERMGPAAVLRAALTQEAIAVLESADAV